MFLAFEVRSRSFISALEKKSSSLFLSLYPATDERLRTALAVDAREIAGLVTRRDYPRGGVATPRRNAAQFTTVAVAARDIAFTFDTLSGGRGRGECRAHAYFNTAHSHLIFSPLAPPPLYLSPCHARERTTRGYHSGRVATLLADAR